VQVVRGLGMQVVGLCDRSRESVATCAQETGLPATLFFDDAFAMLRTAGAEAVVVGTTAPSHAELVTEAAAQGARYILCEKPCATSLREADGMLKTCAERSTVLAVNHQMRFMAQYTQVKELVDSAELGGLVSILVAGSNFGLAMNGSHYFEMFRYMTGGPAETVEAWLDEARVPNPRGVEFEDRAGRVRVTGGRGVAMYLDCSVAAGHGLQVTYVCRYGQIFVDEISGFVRIVRREDAYREQPTTRYGCPAVEEIRRIEPADVIGPTRAVWEAMLAGRPFPDGAAGLHAIRCLCAAHTSHELGGARLRLDDARIDTARRYPWA
jgi:predicted dehydrogenase